ncbi:SDR family NAD(P)-dependent oxidoreductase [Sporolactobacillus pectinivorans]|uniref:SDR family NAD(P)-dependent oxidoreductase n=1 Tax=Sporolactobacillus pectinivorans TaxID=1591408 RepID=UPI0019610B8E|nr:SDR family NAD(P)-dependent oxidoreductase [Sporolactobacillus pectinivorans]
MDKKVWLITGCSRGLGLELCRTLLENDQFVVATSRRKEILIEKIGAENDAFLPVALNLNDEDDIKQKVELAKNKFGRIDVLVNNAGYQHLGTIEDSSDKEVRACFDVNVFATLNMIRSNCSHYASATVRTYF